jgi:hypothetical protein
MLRVGKILGKFEKKSFGNLLRLTFLSKSNKSVEFKQSKLS